MDNRQKLFIASCIALTVTSLTFGIRAGILGDLTTEFKLSEVEIGWVNSMAFFGFPIAMIILGLLYNSLGPKLLMVVACITHLLGLILTIFAGGFWGLIISTFLIGFANGAVEAACNPLIADMFPENKTKMLNKFHVWFPGGIVIGSLLTFFLKGSIGWQALIAIMIIPTLIYGALTLMNNFPKTKVLESNTGENIRAILTSPLFWFIGVCMTMTATAELGTTQWVDKILANTGAHPMILLALVTGLMAVGRYFAGPLVKKFNASGVLLFSAIFTAIGLYLLSTVDGSLIYLAAIVFAVGVTYFWPTMIGFTGENLPKTGALGMSLIGGFGMFGVSIWNPVIGGWLDTAKESAMAMGSTAAQSDLLAGQAVLTRMTVFPVILIFLFAGLYLYMKNRKQATV